MALVYKRSDSKEARAYERSRGMEPNPGVSHMTVVSNPSSGSGRRRVSENPFQWIEGRGQRHRHVSPSYQSLRAAIGWKKRNPKKAARLYPVDERGTLVSRPVSKKLLGNRTRRTGEMAYNIGALRRAMRSNPRGKRSSVKEERTAGGVKVSSRAKPKRNQRKSRRKSRRTSRKKVAPNRRRRTSRRRVTSNKRRRSRRKSTRGRGRGRGTTRRRKSVSPNRRRRSVKTNRRRSRSAGRRRSSRSRSSRRRRSRRTSRNPRFVVLPNRPRRRTSKRRTSKRRGSRRGRSRRTSRRRPGMGSRPLSANKRTKKRKTRRSSKGRIIGYVGKRPVRSTGHVGIDQYLLNGKAPAAVRVARDYNSNRAGKASVRVYSMPRGRGGISKRKTSKGRPRKRTLYGKAYNRTSRPRRRLAANRRHRTSKRRASKRRTSKRRGSRRGRRLTRNMLATDGVRWTGRGSGSRGHASGRLYQVVELGPKSRKAKGKRGRMSGYPVYIPGHVNERAYVRQYVFGGAALDSHTKAKRRGYSEKKYKRRRVRKNSRRTSMRKSRRQSRSRRGRRKTTRNPKYVVANRRRRSRKSSRGRRLRRNQFFGADLMKDVVTPVIGGTAGFVAARVLSNSIANIAGIRNLLDSGLPAAQATKTKVAATLLGIAATLGLSAKVEVVRDNQGALITGMGLALTDRLLSMLTGPAQAYLSGFGEYVNQPLGEYVNQPLGAYVADPGMGETLYAAAGVGEYVNQPLGMYAEGVDPADQGGVDSLMDVMEAAAGVSEAAAGVGTMYATAGLGAMYATAGLGHESDSALKTYYESQQPPFVSTQTPTDIARVVTKTRPADRNIPESITTPEGKGYAGGLFAKNLFGPML